MVMSHITALSLMMRPKAILRIDISTLYSTVVNMEFSTKVLATKSGMLLFTTSIIRWDTDDEKTQIGIFCRCLSMNH